MTPLSSQQIEEAARVDPDHTMASSFLRPAARHHVLVLVLFAHEISRARGAVKEPMLAAIRLQWWRDALSEMAAGQNVRAHPVSQALSATLSATGLPIAMLNSVIDGHEAAALSDAPFADWDGLLGFCDATVGNLHRAMLLAAGLPALSEAAAQACDQAGRALGLAQLVQALPRWSARRASWLPQDRIDALGLAQEDLYGLAHVPALTTILRELRDQAIQAVVLANRALKAAPLGEAFAVLAPAAYAPAQVTARLNTKAPFAEEAGLSLLSRQLRLVWSIARHKL